VASDTEVRNTGHTRHRCARSLKFAVAGGGSWRRDHTSNPFRGKTREYGEKLRRAVKYERKGASMVRKLAFLLVTILLGMSWLGFAESTCGSCGEPQAAEDTQLLDSTEPAPAMAGLCNAGPHSCWVYIRHCGPDNTWCYMRCCWHYCTKIVWQWCWIPPWIWCPVCDKWESGCGYACFPPGSIPSAACAPDGTVRAVAFK